MPEAPVISTPAPISTPSTPSTSTPDTGATWGEPKYGDNGKSKTSQEVDETIGNTADSSDIDGEDDAGAISEDDDFGETVSDADSTGSFPKDIFDKLSSQDPAVKKQAEKQIKRWFFENSRFREAGFESPEEARNLVDKLESWGGVEGIEKETQEAATFWTMLDAGDGGLLDTLEKEHGEGMKKLMPALMDRFQNSDPAGFSHKFAGIFMATLGASKAGEMSALLAFNQLAKKFPDIRKSDEFAKIAEVINAVNDIAQRSPEPAKVDSKLSEREKQLKQQENQLKNQALAGKATPVLGKWATNAMNVAFKGTNLTKEGKKDVIGRIHTEFAALVDKETDRKAARKAFLDSGETEKWLKMVDSDAKRIMPQAARRAKRWYDGITGKTDKTAQERTAEGQSRREAGGGGTTGGTIRTGTPDAKQVDWGRMRAEAAKAGFKDSEDMFMFGRKYFKRGDPRNVYSY